MVTKLSIPLVISTFASNFNNFGNIFMITEGGPARVDNQFAGYTDILASTTYKMTTWSNRYELSATFSVLVFIIVGTFTLVNMHFQALLKKWIRTAREGFPTYRRGRRRRTGPCLGG